MLIGDLSLYALALLWMLAPLGLSPLEEPNAGCIIVAAFLAISWFSALVETDLLRLEPKAWY